MQMWCPDPEGREATDQKASQRWLPNAAHLWFVVVAELKETIKRAILWRAVPPDWAVAVRHQLSTRESQINSFFLRFFFCVGAEGLV